MGVIDDIYSMLNSQRQEQEDLFKRFGVKMTSNNYLILPHKYKEEIGERYHRVRFSKLIEEPTSGRKKQ